MCQSTAVQRELINREERAVMLSDYRLKEGEKECGREREREREVVVSLMRSALWRCQGW